MVILPFGNSTQQAGIAEETRRAFYNQFSSKPFSDIELAAIDANVLTLERDNKTKPGSHAYYQAICKALACDGVITGSSAASNGNTGQAVLLKQLRRSAGTDRGG